MLDLRHRSRYAVPHRTAIVVRFAPQRGSSHTDYLISHVTRPRRPLRRTPASDSGRPGLPSGRPNPDDQPIRRPRPGPHRPHAAQPQPSNSFSNRLPIRTAPPPPSHPGRPATTAQPGQTDATSHPNVRRRSTNDFGMPPPPTGPRKPAPEKPPREAPPPEAAAPAKTGATEAAPPPRRASA